MTGAPLLEARQLGKSYRRGRGRFGRPERVEAFAGVDLVFEPGRVIGLVGRSGSGKSSLARCLAALEPPGAGRLLYRGVDLEHAPQDVRSRFRSEVQLVFQDAARSFHPFWSARQVLEEPLELTACLSRKERRERVAELAERVGLAGDLLDRRARDLSGGQMKRLNLARALTREPRVLILDEPFSGLDVSLQAQISNLLSSLQARRGFACLHVSHDLTMIGRLVDDVLVMEGGRIVERGAVADVLGRPAHAASRALVAASALATTAEAG